MRTVVNGGERCWTFKKHVFLYFFLLFWLWNVLFEWFEIRRSCWNLFFKKNGRKKNTLFFFAHLKMHKQNAWMFIFKNYVELFFRFYFFQKIGLDENFAIFIGICFAGQKKWAIFFPGPCFFCAKARFSAKI